MSVCLRLPKKQNNESVIKSLLVFSCGGQQDDLEPGDGTQGRQRYFCLELERENPPKKAVMQDGNGCLLFYLIPIFNCIHFTASNVFDVVPAHTVYIHH